MKEYIIQYDSINVYEKKVTEAIFDFRVLPCNDYSQIVAQYKISNSIGADLFTFKNLFGFEVKRIRTTKSFNEFNFSLHSIVQKSEMEMENYQFLLKAEEKEILSSHLFFIDHHLFLQKTPYTYMSAENQGLILKSDDFDGIYFYLIALNRYVNELLSYELDTTDVKTTADQSVKLKSGVCQDYTHVFIAMCRYNGIPARYISGYLNQGMDFIGNTLMHAWAEAFVPGVGWIGFDPTNNLRVNEHYIKVSHGADYDDCSPIKGVLKTKGKNKTSYQVKVISNQSQQQ